MLGLEAPTAKNSLFPPTEEQVGRHRSGAVEGATNGSGAASSLTARTAVESGARGKGGYTSTTFSAGIIRK